MSMSNLIRTIDKQLLQQYLDEEITLLNVIKRIGVKMDVAQGAYYKILRKRIKEEGLDVSKLREKTKLHKSKNLKSPTRKIDNIDVFCENSKYDRGTIKRRFMEIYDYKCCLCNQNETWNGRELTLELDHINGINNDNRIENLRLLCPNCHSQETNEFRKRSRKKYICKLCGKEKHKTSIYCNECYNNRKNINEILKDSKRKFNPTKEELENKLKEFNWSWTKVGNYYGVSDNSIKKRCRVLGISYTTKKYLSTPDRTRTCI